MFTGFLNIDTLISIGAAAAVSSALFGAGAVGNVGRFARTYKRSPREAVMQYDPPEMLDLGSVEELTFGGEIFPTHDFITGLKFFIRNASDEDDSEE